MNFIRLLEAALILLQWNCFWIVKLNSLLHVTKKKTWGGDFCVRIKTYHGHDFAENFVQVQCESCQPPNLLLLFSVITYFLNACKIHLYFNTCPININITKYVAAFILYFLDLFRPSFSHTLFIIFRTKKGPSFFPVRFSHIVTRIATSNGEEKIWQH